MAEKRPVSGFLFKSTEEINQANKEAKAAAYLKERLKGRSPSEAAGMYSQILSQNLFHTVVGYTFLKGLQDYLSKNGIKDLEPIQVDSTIVKLQKIEPPPKEAGSTPNPRLEKKLKSLKATLRTTRIVAIVCMLMVITMFAITLTSKSPTIINYESKVLDKYASWEQELTEREKAVSEREANLAGVESDAFSLPDTEVQPDTENLQDTEVQSDSEVQPDAAFQPDAAVRPDSEVQPDTALQPDSEVQPDTALQPDSVVQPDTAVQPDSKVQQDAGVQPDTEVLPDTKVQ